MNSKKTLLTVYTGVMAAICFLGTFIIHIPIPGPFGYVHFGDGFVMLSGFLLGPVYGGLAAGIGSFFADIAAAYPAYSVPTFIIKFLLAFSAGMIYKYTNERLTNVASIFAGLVGMVIVSGGYFITDAFIMKYGIGGALSSLPFNLLQTFVGLVILTTAVPAISKVWTNRLRSGD